MRFETIPIVRTGKEGTWITFEAFSSWFAETEVSPVLKQGGYIVKRLASVKLRAGENIVIYVPPAKEAS
jgi:hypothetical protein